MSFWYVFLLQALMFPFLSFHPLDDATTVRRSQSRTACRRRLSDVARSAACPPKDCGSTGPSSIRSPAHLRWRCTLSTLAAGRWSRSPVWSSLSRTVSSLIPDIEARLWCFLLVCFNYSLCSADHVIQFFPHKPFCRRWLGSNLLLWVWFKILWLQ